MNKKAEAWVQYLGLEKHREGGYFKETYRDEEKYSQEGLPSRYEGSRNFSTAIYFLIEEESYSAFHKLSSDEIWHFYHGDSLNLYLIEPEGELKLIRLGNKIDEGHVFQAVVPKNQWFAVELTKNGEYGLVGCTTAPGFDYKDLTMGKKEELIHLYPQHSELIKRLTRL